MNKQELFKNFDRVELGLDRPFYFTCRNCGKCCKSHEDVLLTPRDLFRIALHLEKTPEEIIREYCECYMGAGSRFPIVRLGPRGINNACPLLENNRCKVHASKPMACALFPLGRALVDEEYSSEGERSKVTTGYILNPVDCGSTKKIYTVRQWIEQFDISIEDTFHSEWIGVFTHISPILQKIEDTVPDETFMALQNMLIGLLYVRYDPARDFSLQFSENAKESKRRADKLAARLKESDGDNLGGN